MILETVNVIGAGVSAIKDASELLRGVSAYLKSKKERDPHLEEMFFDLRTKLLDMSEIETDLRNRVRELEEQLQKIESVRFNEMLHVYEDVRGQKYCPVCFEKETKLYHLKFTPQRSVGYERISPCYTCIICRFSVNVSK